MINSPQSSWSFFIPTCRSHIPINNSTETSQLYKKDNEQSRTVQDSPTKTVKKTRKIAGFWVEKITGLGLGFMLKIFSNPLAPRFSHFISTL